MEWHLARAIGHHLADQGFAVGASQPLEYPSCTDRGVSWGDARAVVVIWPLNYTMLDGLELAAREASQNGRLVQLYASDVRPKERYYGPEAIDFVGWDLKPFGPKWTALLHDLKPLCGPPPRISLELLRRPATVAMAIGAAVAGVGGAASYMVYRPADPTPMLAMDPQLTAPQAEPIRTIEDVERVEPGIALGGELYIQTKDDLGVDVIELAPIQDKPPAPEQRAPQGPEP
jgi:hypothetical protein